MLAASVLLCEPALASGLAPSVAAQTDAPLQKSGHGRMTFWGFDVYDAALWSAQGFRASQFAAHPFVLELNYLRAFSAQDIARASLDQMRRHGPFNDEQARRWQERLAAVLPDVRRGDRLAGVHRPGRGVAFFHNDRPVGQLDDPQFARLFFAIWLGEATSAPALRQALIAGATP